MVPWVGLRFVIVVFPDHTRLFLLKRGEQEREMKLLKLRAETGVKKSEMGSKSLRPKLPKFFKNKKMTSVRI